MNIKLPMLAWVAAALAGCDMIGPRVADVATDAPVVMVDAGPDAAPDAAPDAPPGPRYLLPAGSTVPVVSGELASQIKLFDGITDSLTAVPRVAGKASGVAVMYWSFGSSPIEGNFGVSAPVYVLVDNIGGVLTPRTDHPWVLDTVPGDTRYTAMRKIMYVPTTPLYAGQVLPSLEAVAEAIDLGLLGDPQVAGTWRNLPVVETGKKLVIGGGMPDMSGIPVYAHGVQVEVMPVGYIQPLRNGGIPIGQEDRLLSGVATGLPPVLPTALDAQPVFQYGIPAAPPGTTFNYTPLVTEVDVRLANGIAPATITNDNQLFTRSATGAITGYYTDNVASYTVTTTTSNKQIQFVDGAP